MAGSTLTISPRVLETSEIVRYEFDLGYSNSSRRETLFYEFPRQLRPHADNFDGILCATVLHAMAEGRDIHLRGPATSAGLRNLHEFQLAWARWLPDVYRPIAIEVESVIGHAPPGRFGRSRRSPAGSTRRSPCCVTRSIRERRAIGSIPCCWCTASTSRRRTGRRFRGASTHGALASAGRRAASHRQNEQQGIAPAAVGVQLRGRACGVPADVLRGVLARARRELGTATRAIDSHGFAAFGTGRVVAHAPAPRSG